MGTEDQILKGRELITNTKKQRLKIQRLESPKYNIKKKKQNCKSYKKNMKFPLKIGPFSAR